MHRPELQPRKKARVAVDDAIASDCHEANTIFVSDVPTASVLSFDGLHTRFASLPVGQSQSLSEAPVTIRAQVCRKRCMSSSLTFVDLQFGISRIEAAEGSSASKPEQVHTQKMQASIKARGTPLAAELERVKTLRLTCVLAIWCAHRCVSSTLQSATLAVHPEALAVHTSCCTSARH